LPDYEKEQMRFACEPIAITVIFRKQKDMTESTEKLPTPHSEEHMLGHGFYNKHSHEQAKANTYGLPLIVEAINRIDLAQIGSEFRIADYGSAQGLNSLLPMKTAVAQIRTVNLSDKRTPETRQQVIDLFSQRLQSALAQDPQKYSCRWVLHLMLISKKQN
jgi:hypothetical protein